VKSGDHRRSDDLGVAHDLGDAQGRQRDASHDVGAKARFVGGQEAPQKWQTPTRLARFVFVDAHGSAPQPLGKIVTRIMAQKLNVTAKTNVASSEPGASQYVVRFTSLYLNPINGPRRTSELKPDACVRSTTIPSRNQSAGEALSSDQL